MRERKAVSPPFSVVLVNYKTYELTRVCLELLREPARQIGFTVWVIDNNSGDESTAYLRSLDWIRLIERMPPANEAGFLAHGRALDLALDQATTESLFLLHTDTFVHNPAIFKLMLDQCQKKKVIAVGCLEQIYRGELGIYWRIVSRFLKHYARRARIAFGLKSRQPKPYLERYIKSFCALWNIKVMKEHGWRFEMGDANPSYVMQDRAIEAGYTIGKLAPRRVFKYLDHVESGTVSGSGHNKRQRRIESYNLLLAQYQKKINLSE